MALPPTVILLDSLNTNMKDLLRIRGDMIHLLKSRSGNSVAAKCGLHFVERQLDGA